MCRVLKIPMKGRFDIVYRVFAEDDEKKEKLVTESNVGESLEIIRKWKKRADKADTDRYTAFKEISTFADLCLMFRGTETINLQNALEEPEYLMDTLSVTHAVLKKMFPDKRISFSMVQKYAGYYALLREILGTRYVINQDTGRLFGIWNQLYDYDHMEPFRLEDHVHLPSVGDQKINKQEEIHPDMQQQEKELKKCRQENDELRRKVKSLTADNKGLRAELSKDRKLKEQMKQLQEERIADKAELTALRDFVYSQSVEYEPSVGITMEQMAEELRKHKIMIVGGHISWQNKVKQMFPNWILIAPHTNMQFHPQIYEGVEKVYFYTNYINHSTKSKFFDEIKSKRIPFGYLNQVNLEQVVRKIYCDIFKP